MNVMKENLNPHNSPYYAIYEYKTERKLNENKVIKSAETILGIIVRHMEASDGLMGESFL